MKSRSFRVSERLFSQNGYKRMKSCDQNIKSTFKLVKDMIKLAEKGGADREDVGCGILYGIILDSAYRIKEIAEKEKQMHIQKGWWA